MDLNPFNMINPCGHAGLEVTQLKDLGVNKNQKLIVSDLVIKLCEQLGYQKPSS